MYGIIGDPHFRESLPYGDHLPGKRQKEWDRVLATIVKELEDCDTIVFMGDNFNTKNKHSSVVRHFTEYVEKFRGKRIIILAGNHEKLADGRTAIDYLKEIHNPDWHIVTYSVLVTETYDRIEVFCT